MGRILVVLTVLSIGLAQGCGPSIKWVRNPGPEDQGLRYYRPKPYLLLAPGPATGEADPAKAGGPDHSACAYKLTLSYLPDYSEEYSVHLRTGLGTSKLTVNLENGWNLTSVVQDLDSKTSDNVNAAVGLIKAVSPGGLLAPPSVPGAAKSRDGGGPAAPHEEAIVYGNEVPIGYFESAIDRDPIDGSKRLVGFRYVGFLPFAAGPVGGGPGNPSCSRNGAGPLYGLVLEKGVLLFKTLDDLAQPTAIPVPLSPPAVAVASANPKPVEAPTDSTSKPSNPTRKAEPSKEMTPQSVPPATTLGPFSPR